MSGSPVTATPRLALRRFDEGDAPFVLALLNDAAFLRFIGDRGVRSLEDAHAWIEAGPRASYERNGFGLYVVETRNPVTTVGMCGILKRDQLPDPDLGFAFAAEHRAKGYGGEAASAVLEYARDSLGLTRIAAIVSPDNAPSLRALTKLGFVFERMVRMAENEPEILYLACELDGRGRQE